MMSATKKSTAAVKAAIKCLVYALIIAMARLNGDRKYPSYSYGYGLKEPVEDLLKDSGFDLSSGGGFHELEQFQEHLSV